MKSYALATALVCLFGWLTGMYVYSIITGAPLVFGTVFMYAALSFCLGRILEGWNNAVN